VLTALACGAVAAPVARIAPDPFRQESFLLRPPGAVEEAEFQRRCVRCGECLKVCIGGALHPAFLQAGATGLWTPLLIPRLGYCEYNCTLCGQVCPTGAIRRLPLEEKKKVIIGLAVFDKNRCLPFARGEECLVCEEHCPTPEKAIVFEEKEVVVNGISRRLKVPAVIRSRCIGCGICETRCPLEGASAIRVINQGESRRPRDGLNGGDQGGYG
jgi:MauM/NapG family ferredoxin protein